MSVPAEAAVPEEPSSAPLPDRRAEVDARQALVAALLQEVGCDILLLLERENFAWATAGGSYHVLGPDERPALLLTAEQRWLLAANVDSQRLFDEELDGLGFQLKEWQWYAGRAPFLADLCQGRKVACDQPFGECRVIDDRLRQLRRVLTPYDMAMLRELGRIIGHALEATCRTLATGQSEQEVAGQLAHRLLHRGVEPVGLEIAADGRYRRYRRPGYTAGTVQQSCVLTATGRQAGLHAAASRTVCFGPPSQELAREHDAACKISATCIAGGWPDILPRDVLASSRRIYQITGFEHEWRPNPIGYVTGRAAVEMPLVPQTADPFRAGWALTWQPGVGAACSCDTYLVTPEGPKAVTPMGSTWPQKRIKIQGGSLVRPDILQR